MADSADRHQHAVESVRAGDYAAAIPELRDLHESFPENETFLHDYISALSWNQEDQAAVDLEPMLNVETAPLYVVDAIAKSARNARAYGLAEKWYRRALATAPDNLDFTIGLAFSLAEAGEYDRANAVFAALPTPTRNSPPVLAARAYIQRLGGQLIAALHAYDLLLAEQPNDFDALRGKALVLRDLLLPEQALALARPHPGILTGDEIARLEVDALAVQLRITADTAYPREMDGQLLDRTIEAIENHLAQSEPSPAALALEYDRIAALTERNEADKAIAAFEALDTPDQQIPAYVLSAAGKAYLQAEEPQEAVRLLELAHNVPPVDLETELSLIYAYLDTNRFNDAARLVADTLDRYPMLLRSADSVVIKGNEDRMRAEVVAAIADSSIERHALAQSRLESILADSPNNPDVRHELANIYRWRGWLERSVFEYDQVLTMDDTMVYAQAGRAFALLEAQEYPAVEATVNSLSELQNPEPVVGRLSERWRVHNRSELIVAAQSGESSGNTFGNSQRTVDAWWFTRPIAYNYRAFVHLHDAYSEFPDGDASRQRTGVGTEYRNGPWRARGELLFDRQYSNVGVAGDADWRMSDRWQLGAQIASNSSDTQLRGYRVNVESDAVGLNATMTLNESGSYSFGVRHTSFNDGNRFRSIFGNLYRRVMTRPRSLVHFNAGVSFARNSQTDVNYFAPRRDRSLTVAAEHDWRIRRRYDRVLSQRVGLQLGNYYQRGYGSGGTWQVRYAIDMSLSDALSFEFGLQRSRNRYDGLHEYNTTFLATLQARL